MPRLACVPARRAGCCHRHRGCTRELPRRRAALSPMMPPLPTWMEPKKEPRQGRERSRNKKVRRSSKTMLSYIQVGPPTVRFLAERSDAWRGLQPNNGRSLQTVAPRRRARSRHLALSLVQRWRFARTRASVLHPRCASTSLPRNTSVLAVHPAARCAPRGRAVTSRDAAAPARDAVRRGTASVTPRARSNRPLRMRGHEFASSGRVRGPAGCCVVSELHVRQQ